MNQDKILKIIKGLNRFCPDDIAIMAGLDEIKTNFLLEKFLQEGLIAKLSGLEYRYINKMPERREIFRLVEKPVIKLIPDNDITFKQAAEYFLTNHALKNCTPSTLQTYISITKVHLIPFFNKMELKDITQKYIKDFIDLKQKQHLSNRRIRNCITLLGNMFNKFKEWGFVSDSPYNGVINVSFSTDNSIKVLNETEVNSLLKKARTKYPKLYPFTLLAISTGLKRAEILALKKQDIDLEKRKINVNKTMYEGKMLIPRSKTVLRQVDIPDNIAKEFKKIMKNRREGDFMFYDRSISCFTQDKQIRNNLAKLFKELRLEKIAFNDLRHTYAYNTLQQGKSIDYLHKQLGDYYIQATMDKYREFIV